MLDLPEDEEVCWTGEEFKKMKNLKILKVINAKFSTGPKYLPNSLRVLDWEGYPSPSLPSDFRPRKLSMLNLPNCSLKLDNPLKVFKHTSSFLLLFLWYQISMTLSSISSCLLLLLWSCRTLRV